MSITRRHFVARAALATAALPASGLSDLARSDSTRSDSTLPALARNDAQAQTRETVNAVPLRIGMTDWNLGQRGDISKIALAREIGLDGIQVSVQYPTDGTTPTLRDAKTQEAFRRAALDNGIQICSLAIGSPGKARLPLHKSPAAAILLTEAVEIAHNLGTNNILLPILGDSHIDMANQAEVDTFVTTMKEVARYAERYGVVIGLEDWISAEHNNTLLDAIGSEYIAVYYDPHNIVRRVKDLKDIYAEPKVLGTRINQVHVKNGDMLLSGAGGVIEWPRMAQQLHDIGYRGWYVLETSSPSKDIVADTRANIEYVRKIFRIPVPQTA